MTSNPQTKPTESKAVEAGSRDFCTLGDAASRVMQSVMKKYLEANTEGHA